MSTILKALKKLEQDKERSQAGGLPPGYKGPGSTHLQPRQGFGRFSGPMLHRSLILLIVLSLGGATFYFYRQSRTIAPSPVPTVAETKPSVKSAPPPVARTSTQAKPQVAQPSPHSKPPTVISKPGKPPVQALSAAKSRTTARTRPAPVEWQSLKELTRPTPDVSTPSPPKADRRIKAISPPGQKPVVPPTPAKKPASAQEDPYQDIAPLTDGRLKVQAIAWSPVVEDRMAVINTRIVHEGDKVDGFLVSAIRHDDVVVNEKGAFYRVVFGRP